MGQLRTRMRPDMDFDNLVAFSYQLDIVGDRIDLLGNSRHTVNDTPY